MYRVVWYDESDSPICLFEGTLGKCITFARRKWSSCFIDDSIRRASRGELPTLYVCESDSADAEVIAEIQPD